MQYETIELERIEDHPHNSNVMPPALFEKLKGHIRDTGRYPPLIVRPIQAGDNPPRYQLLDGHHRAMALRQLQHATAQCMIWDADDKQALVLLATLNRLEGRDDPRKRARLMHALRRRVPMEAMFRRLPEDAVKTRRMLQLADPPPKPRRARALADMPVAVHFFLLPEQKRRLEAALRAMDGSREEALLRLVEGGER